MEIMEIMVRVRSGQMFFGGSRPNISSRDLHPPVPDKVRGHDLGVGSGFGVNVAVRVSVRSCRCKYRHGILPTALAWEVMQSAPSACSSAVCLSVCPSDCFHSIFETD